MDNLHFIPNNIHTNFFEELTKYKNGLSIIFKSYIYELYYAFYCIFLMWRLVRGNPHYF